MAMLFRSGNRRPTIGGGVLWLCACSTALAADAPVEFNRDIRPLLSDRCFACHGPDANHRQAELRLDVESSAKESAIVPGDVAGSELWQRISSDDPELRMPPPDSGKQLTQAEIELLRRWLEQGAVWQGHWAFEPIRRPPLPTTQRDGWVQNPIDRFVLHRLEQSGLEPTPRASRETLIRRLSLDLVGLPPSLPEIDAFLSDRSDDALETVVDRLLESPRYGERMAMDWLDGARFADTNGYQNDFGRSMWPWRDWVINAFNQNLPFDQFTIEQIAGDLLPDASTSQIVATGFNRNHRSVTEGGSIEEEWHVENVVDRVETVSSVFLGLTMGCCRCHDHKYDPITQKEFYQFFAFFNNVDEKGVYIETRGNVPPLIEVATPDYAQRERELQVAIAAAETAVEAEQQTLDQRLAAWRASWSGSHDAASGATIQIPLSDDLSVQRADGPSDTLTATAAGPLTWTAGLLGPALTLAGTNDVELTLAQGADWDGENAFSFSLWLRRDHAGALISKMDDTAAFRGWDAILLEDGNLKVHLVNAWPQDALAVLTQSPIAADVWTPITITYDGSRKASGVTVYVAGNPVAVKIERDSLQGSIRTPQPVRIGRRSSSLPLAGSLRNIRLDDHCLAGDQVRARIATDLSAAAGNHELRDTAAEAWRRYFTTYHQADAAPAQTRLLQLQAELATHRRGIPTVMVLKERAERRPTYRLQRGQYDLPDKREELLPDVPAFLPPLPPDAPRDRLSLAKWLVDENNPLVARVVVNRLWQRFSGQGLLKSTENFGAQADAPSDPQLLDWLASELMRTGWDLKAIQKLIVMSATYQQSSAVSAELAARDPENRLLARGPRFRLSAELIRDNALAVSGLLNGKLGGPSVKPYQPAGMWLELAGGASQGAYVPDKGPDLYRRSLYTYRKRTVPHATTSTFDAPSWEICQVKRGRTNTPLQALALLNDTTYVEASRKLGERMLKDLDGPDDRRLEYGFRLATGRRPDVQELGVLQAALSKYQTVYGLDAAAADQLLAQGDSPSDPSLEKSRLAAFTTVASILFNLDETITKE